MAYKTIKRVVFYIFRYEDDGVWRGQIQTRKEGVKGWLKVKLILDNRRSLLVLDDDER